MGRMPTEVIQQMAGAAASPASDVYAATATFYECLVGQPPFLVVVRRSAHRPAAPGGRSAWERSPAGSWSSAIRG